MKKTQDEIFRDSVEQYERDKERRALLDKALANGTLVDPGQCPIHKVNMVFYFDGSDVTNGNWECWACKWKRLAIEHGTPLPQMYYDLLKKVEGDLVSPPGKTGSDPPKSKVQGQ